MRVLQDASGETRLVDDICVKMVDGNYCEITKGEEAPTSPTYDEHFVMWKITLENLEYCFIWTKKKKRH